MKTAREVKYPAGVERRVEEKLIVQSSAFPRGQDPEPDKSGAQVEFGFWVRGRAVSNPIPIGRSVLLNL